MIDLWGFSVDFAKGVGIYLGIFGVTFTISAAFYIAQGVFRK